MTEELKKTIESEEARADKALTEDSPIPLGTDPEPPKKAKKAKTTAAADTGPRLVKFSVSRADLAKELSLAADVCERKTTIPILTHTLIETSTGRVTLKATDLENAIQTTTPAKVSGVGAVAVPTKRLQDILGASPEDEISISEQDGHWLKIVAGRTNYRLACMSPDSFPTLPSLPPMLFDAPAAQLLAMAERVGFAISTEESRYTLNAALFETGPAGGQMVSTDGHRLAIHAVNGFSAPESKLLVPKKALAELVKICKDAEEDSRVQIAKDDSHLFFTCGERLLICRQLSGQFPDYKAVIPKDNNITITAERAALVSVIKRVSLLSNERSCAIRLTLKPSTLHLEASGDTGNSEDEISITTDSDQTMTELIGFNFKYLLDFLANIDAENVHIHFKDNQTPALFTIEDGGKYVLMPMRI